MKTTEINDYKREEIREYILENYKDYDSSDIQDLHHYLFNTDYYIIGTYQAIKWCGDEVFNIIKIIKEYEENNFGNLGNCFGEVYTDLSNPEQVVTMYCYIVGEELLHEMKEELEGVE